MVNDHVSIRWTYLNSWFGVDLISSIPAEYIVPDSGSSGILFRAVKMFKLVKLMRVLRLGRLVSKAQEAFGVKNGTVMIIKFAGVLLVAAHWLGCLFYFFTAMDDGPDTWLKHYLSGTATGSIGSRSNIEIYIAVLYWALTTMSTIGYGDIIPISTEERCIVMVAMVIGACTFAYGLTNVCFLIYNFNRYQVSYEAAMDENLEFYARHEIPHGLYSRIQKYFDFKHYATRIEDDPELQRGLEAALPTSLHRNLKLCILKQILRGLGGLHVDPPEEEREDNQDESQFPCLFYAAATRPEKPLPHGKSAQYCFEYELAKLMEGAVFTPDDVVVNGASGRLIRAVTLLSKGTLNLELPQQGGTHTVSQGTVFGEVAVVLGRPMIGTDFIAAVPDQYVEVFSVPHGPLIELLSADGEVYKSLMSLYRLPEYQRDYFEYHEFPQMNQTLDRIKKERGGEAGFVRSKLPPMLEEEVSGPERQRRQHRMHEVEGEILAEQAELLRLKAELTKLKNLKLALTKEGVSLAHESDFEAIGLGEAGEHDPLMRQAVQAVSNITTSFLESSKRLATSVMSSPRGLLNKVN